MDIPIDIPAGLKSDDTTYSEAPGWADGSNVRFRLGRPETIGGWEGLTDTLLSGVCRAALAWTDNNNATLNVAFGTHSNLQVWQGGTLVDITPLGPITLLGADPLTVTNGSPTVAVAHTGHGLTTGQSVSLSGASAVGGITPNGTFPITVIDANTYRYTFTSNATSSTTGGGSNVVETRQATLPAGAIDGTGTSGFGTGGWGVGGFGEPSTSDYFPRTWSLSPWGQKLLASPRNGGLYEWSNVLASAAVAVPAAPARITQMLVAPQRQVFALGCTQENGTWNPLCLRHCGVGDETQWATDSSSSSTAREYVLPGGGRIVGGRFVGKYLLVWTTQSLFLGTYVGQVTQVWRFDKVGDKCGLIGPNAAAVLDQQAFWISPDRQVHTYSPGATVAPVPCPIRRDFADNLAASQADKIVASTIAEFGEVRFDYPDAREGTENSRYIAFTASGPDAGAWYRGSTLNGVNPARTAMFDAGPATSPIGVTADGHAYWHERGHSADGGKLPWFIQSADVYLDENNAILVREIWPDIAADQLGPVTFTLTSRLYPQGDQETWPSLTIAPGEDRLDFKASGRLFQITYSGDSSPSFARIGRLVVDGKARGRKG